MAKRAKSKSKKRRISKRKVLRLVLVLALIIYGPIALIQHCGDDESRKLSESPEKVLPHINDSLQNERSTFEG